MAMIIKVEQKHIDAGERGSKCNCPIAISLKETLGIWSVWVSNKTVKIGDKRKRLPKEAREFISNYDFYDGSPVSPFEFELPLK
jgi:hypothetical protein